ncbi:MAG: hypothetical protein ABIG30_01180 [Candidatus Aenigmatarchaeota archaeon]
MLRKVIKQGHNTLTVTLPSQWVKRYGVTPGSEIEVCEQDKALMITTENGPSLSETTIDISGLSPELIWRFVSSAYRAGYNEITVTGLNGHEKRKIFSAFSYNTLDCLKGEDISAMSAIETIQALANRLIGMEVIDQKEKYCRLKELGETTYKEFDNALRRIFLLLKNESENITNGIDGKKSCLKDIHILDTNIDRFEDFCLRVMNKKGYSDFRRTPIVYNIIFTLELLGDEYKRTAIHLLEDKIQIKSELIKWLADEMKKQIERYYALFYKFDKEKVVEIFNMDNEMTQKVRKSQEKLTPFEREMLHHLKKIGIHLKSLTELRIDMEY